jgi:hypothetical protein
MALTDIDATKPVGSEKGKTLDDYIREFKQKVKTNLATFSNYIDDATATQPTVPALRTAVWNTAGRPTGTSLVDRVTGYNTDLGVIEYYDLGSTSWKVAGANGVGSWTVASRPSSPYTGQTGYNTDLAVTERYNGTSWVRISGDPRGKIDMWSGTVAAIPTGWVLADGVQRTHPEGGNYTPPNLRNRFIVGAGQDGGTYTPGVDGIGTGYYAPGATGGEDKHTQTEDELVSHIHGLRTWASTDSGVAYAEGGSSANYTSSSAILATGGGQPMENRPPYYALCYLYKL